ncbi:MAG: hypothetical protein J0I06_14845 [Planctomycetes bacterium]|nr:hypothetical protein [Planctomycetota bacterium]
MPITRRLVRVAPIALSLVLLTTPLTVAGPQPQQPPEPPKSRPSVEVEVKYVDDSTMKLKLLDDKLELSTKYGVLHVAVADVRRIEFANRVPADVAEKVILAISKLNHPDFKVREEATAELKGYRERAYPLVLKALKHDDPEVSRRADEVVKFLHAKVPAALLEARDYDVVHTDDSKITGRLTAEVLRVGTFQFGEQQLKLADLRTLRSGPAAASEEQVAAAQAPGNMSAYQQQFGKEVTFAVTGFTPVPGANPSLWGTDVYTLDSNLAAAVVHAGLAKPGETVVVKVRVVQSPPQFVSSFRNNVNSTAYGNYPAGGYEFVRR